jgi:hypothetical protein
LTELPTGVVVDVIEAFAVLAVGNVPVANPKLLLICELELDKTI